METITERTVSPLINASVETFDLSDYASKSKSTMKKKYHHLLEILIRKPLAELGK